MMVFALLVLLSIFTTQTLAIAQPLTRARIAVILGPGIHGSNFTPPAATGIFDDVSVNDRGADWIEQFYKDGITSGCGQNPLRYCPTNHVTRDQMAIFLLRSKYGKNYTPPPATGIFDDVPVTRWAAEWIEQLYREKITSGCSASPLRYCPDSSVTGVQASLFVARTFGGPPAPVPKTGQTHSEAPGDDGDLQKGVPWPDPRFTDNGDGTVTDNLTGLIWLKNADCFGELEWEEALTASAQMANGDCELSDGSRPGDWRLSNVKELYSLIAFANPGLGNALPAGHPFDVPEFRGWEDIYWTGTYLYRWGNEYPVAYAYTIDVMHGLVLYGTIWECNPTGCSNETRGHVWPVRGGN